MKLFDRKTSLQKKYPLITWQDTPILRAVCDPIKKITPEIKEFAKALQELMRAYEWVGLAAPQIGQNHRMAAVTQRDTSERDKDGRVIWDLTKEFVMINPKILAASDNLKTDNEACLSLPWINGDVARPHQITIQYLWVDGKTHVHKATGFNARVILHEMDHLDGVLFIDKLA